ncbi:NRDE family protein [Halocola ammonii]
MCTIAFTLRENQEYPFVLIGNRDEFYRRPTEPMHWWNGDRRQPSGPKDMLAGKDLDAGGTWMGLTATGKFAAITNFRDLDNLKENAPSRGALVNEFLQSAVSPEEFMEKLEKTGNQYNGFNLLFGTLHDLNYYTNYNRLDRNLASGVHGISNAYLNDKWPKVELLKSRLRSSLRSEHLNVDELLDHLSSREKFTENLPDTGLSEEMEKEVSATCIVTPDYGTRVSTVITMNKRGVVSATELNRQTGERKEYQFTLLQKAIF